MLYHGPAASRSPRGARHLHSPPFRAPCSLNSEMMDCAFFRLPDGQAWLGWGPFAETAEPVEEACFYVNDFTLSDAKPWKAPSRLERVASAGDLNVGDGALPRIAWDRPQAEW